MSDRIAIADGREVAGAEKSGPRPRIGLLSSMLRTLERSGYDVVVVVDDELRLEIERSDNPLGLEKATIEEMPSKSEGVPFLLGIADEIGAVVVSNDNFEEYRSEYPWIADRIMPYRVFSGEVYLDPVDLMGVF